MSGWCTHIKIDEIPKETSTKRRWDMTRWNHNSIKFRLIDGDKEIEDGIKLIKSNGHVSGYQLILLKLPETGPVLLTVDAILNTSTAH